jgi:regulator of RNase E activity RraA
MGLPVFSVGTNPNGPTKNVAGRIGHPINCGGVSVRSGDLIVATPTACSWRARARGGLLPLARKKVEDEAARIAAIKKGDTAASWLVAALRTAAC